VVYPTKTRYDFTDYEIQQVNERIQANNNKKTDSTFIAVSKRTPVRTEVTGNKSLAAASMDNLVTVLKPDQLKQCGLAYINNGIVRTIVDRTVYFINPERTDFVIEPNEELITGVDDEEVKKLEEQIKNDTLTDPETGESLNIAELRRKLVRINKRVRLHSQLDKLLASTLIFGRGALLIVKFSDADGGEPRALRHLSSTRIKSIIADEQTGQFEGLEYDDGKATADGPKKYQAKQLIPAFNDDYNVLDNSNFSGLSAVWPILEAANTIDVILAEDMPEVARQGWSKFGFLYAGTSKKSTINRLKEELEAGTFIVHNEQALTADVHDLSLDPMKLAQLIDSLSKHMSMAMNIPQFLLFEDTANFATANQVMQCFKAGVLKRYRTWLQGILEDYWYDPILADHLGIELKDVISAPIRIKAVFQDINFETRKEIIEADEKLQNMMVFTNVDTAKDIDRKDVANRLQLEQNEINKAVKFQTDMDIAAQMAANKTQGAQQPNTKKANPFGSSTRKQPTNAGK